MRTQCTAEQLEFFKVGRQRVVAAFDGGRVSLRIPAHAGPQFRSMPAGDSGACRARIPVHAGPPFRRMPGRLM